MTGRIHVFPAWEQNPYLNMLYIGARSEGWRVDGSKTVNMLAAALGEMSDGDILHIHWTSPVLHHSDGREGAELALARFADLLADFKRAGGRLIWTVHNALTHDALYPDLEVRLAHLLIEHSDRILQINKRTRDVVSEFYDLPPEKLVTLPHASYAGVYAEPPAQHEARQRLGVLPGAAVVGFVGQMRAYKGLPTLLRAMTPAQRIEGNLQLVLAGKTPPEDIPQIESELPVGVPVVRQHTFVSDADLATWFAACDVMVFPYERVLNSGSILLAATFGRPCILPAEPHLVAEYGDQPWVMFYETGERRVEALAESISVALAGARQMRVSARDFALQYTTAHMAWDYVALIREMLSAPATVSEEIR